MICAEAVMSDSFLEQMLHLNCMFKSVTLNLFLGKASREAREAQETKLGLMTAAATI